MTLYNNFLLKRGVGLFSGDYGTLVAERLCARQLILHSISASVYYIYVYVCVTLRNAISGASRGRLVFKMASPPVTRIVTLQFWRTKDQKFGQVDHLVLPKLACYSSNTIKVCVASASTEI